jgi:hypothetical protein
MEKKKLLAGLRRVFAGVFMKSGCFDVVFWWCKDGVLRGKRGVYTPTFSAPKNVTRF